MPAPSWAKLVRAEAKKRGMLLREVAALIGVDPSTFSLYLSGQRNMRVTQLIELAEKLGLDPAQFLLDDQSYIIFDDEERALLDHFRAQSSAKKAAILSILGVPSAVDDKTT